MPNKSHVFISYSRRDTIGTSEPYAGIPERIKNRLEKDGYVVWLDKADLPPGTYEPEIREGIQESFCVIACLTPRVLKDRECQAAREISYARDTAKIPIIPVRFLTDDNLLETQGHLDVWFVDGAGNMAVEEGLENLCKMVPKAEKMWRERRAAEKDPFEPYVKACLKYLDGELQRLGQLLTLASTEAEEHVGPTDKLKYDLSIAQYDRQTCGSERDNPDNKEREVFRSFDEAFDKNKGRMLLLGDPGAGKTTVLRIFARRACQERLRNRDAPLPIFIPLGTWKTDLDEPSAADSEQRLATQPPIDLLTNEGVLHQCGLREQAKELIKQGKALLILDGLDELPAERRIVRQRSFVQTLEPERIDQLREKRAKRGGPDLIVDENPIGSKAESGPTGEENRSTNATKTYDARLRFINLLKNEDLKKAQLVVSCRVRDYEKLPEGVPLDRAVRLMKLTDEQIESYFSDMRALWEAVKSTKNLLDELRSPLLLSIFKVAYEDLNDEAKELKDLSEGEIRDAVFEKFVTRQYGREEKRYQCSRGDPKSTLGFSLDDLTGALELLALNNMTSDEEGVLYWDDIYAVLNDEERCEDFVKLASDLHVLDPVDETEGTYRFKHLLLRDYLAYKGATKHIGDKAYRPRCAEALVKLSTGDTRALETLLDWRFFLQGETYEEVITVIIKAVCSGCNHRAIDVLLETLRSGSSPELRIFAMDLLCDYEDSRISAALVAALKDSDAAVRSFALKALAGLDFDIARSHLPMMLTDDEESHNFGDALDGWEDGFPFETPEEFVDDPLIHEAWWSKITPANVALALIIQSGDTDALLTASKAAEPRTRLRAAFGLAKLGHEKALDIISEALGDIDWSTRSEAVEALLYLRDENSLEMLVRQVEIEPNPELCCIIAETLGVIGEKAADPLIESIGRTTGIPRAWAVWALGAVGRGDDATILVDMLDDESAVVRGAAAVAVARMYCDSTCEEQIVERLVSLLRDNEIPVSVLAAWSLAAIGNPAAIEPLVELFCDPGVSWDPPAYPVPEYTSSEGQTDNGEEDPQVTTFRVFYSRLDEVRSDLPGAWIILDVGQVSHMEAVRDAIRSFKEAAAQTLSDMEAETDPIDKLKWIIYLRGACGGPEAIRPLCRYLEHSDSSVRNIAVLALKFCLGPANFYFSCRDEDFREDQSAIRSEIVGYLTPILSDTQVDETTCKCVLEILEAIGTPEALALIQSALRRPEDGVRLAALKTLQDVDSRPNFSMEHALEDMRKSENMEVRIETIKTLAQMRTNQCTYDRNLIEELIYLLRDDRVDPMHDVDSVRGSLFDSVTDMVQAPSSPDPALNLFVRAINLLLNGKHSAAMRVLNRAIELEQDPGKWFLYYWRGEIGENVSAPDLSQCAKDYQRTIDLHGDCGYAWRSLGIVLFKQGKFEEALNSLGGAASHPSSAGPFTFHWLGRTYYALKQYDNAIQCFENVETLSDEPQAVDFHWLGCAYLDSGKYEKAETEFSKAIKLRDEKDPVDYFWRGRARYEQGDYAGAGADFTEAADHFWLGRLRCVAGDYRTAEKEMRIHMQKHRYEYAVSNFWLGVFALDQREYSVAVDRFTDALSDKPEGLYYFFRAVAHTALRDWEKALNDLDEETKLGFSDPPWDNIYSTIWRGIILEARGQVDGAAREKYDEAETIARESPEYSDPGYAAVVNRILSLVSLMKGDGDSAKRYYQKALVDLPQRHSHLKHRIYLKVISEALPNRKDIAEFRDWLEEQLGPPPSLSEE